jgi:N-acyl homoserine lactone hydrolase
MSVNGLYLFPGGRIKVDKSVITYRIDMGKEIEIPVIMALLDTSDGIILYDTGLDPEGLEDPINYWGAHVARMISKFGPEDDVRNRLKELGLEPRDVKYVINSHLHYDHTGGNQYFSDSTFIVQKAEFRYAKYPDSFAAGAYLKKQFELPLKYELIEGDTEMVSDVSLIFTPGHTPGNQSLLIKLSEMGTIVLTGDAIYCHENIEKMIPPGNCVDPVQAMNSISRLIHIAKREGGHLFINHDPEAWTTLKASPYRYK